MLKVITKLSKFRSICECAECGTHYETSHYDAAKSRLGHLCKACKSTSGQPLTQALLKKFYNYDPLTGVVTARLEQHNYYAGEVVGYVANTGYISLSVGCKEYLLHRIIWLYMTGNMPDQVDHIDHDRLNNKWDNLREVNNTDNSKNASISKNSSTKINGVSFMKSRGKYRAYITVNRKQISLGLYDTEQEAAKARRDADIKYGFHPNHGN